MRGPALHHRIVDRLKAAIQANSGLDNAELQALLADPKNLPHLFVRCHGPDPYSSSGALVPKLIPCEPLYGLY